MVVGPTVHYSQKISGGLQKIKKGGRSQIAGCPRKGGCKVVPSYGLEVLKVDSHTINDLSQYYSDKSG